jgi:hypothetical protein
MVQDRDRPFGDDAAELIDQSQDLLFRLKAVELRHASMLRRGHALMIAALLALVENSPIVSQLLDL